MSTELESLKFPIGKYQVPSSIDAGKIASWLTELEEFPYKLSTLTEGLTDEQLDTPYRPGGWTVRQLLVHIGDSHLSSYVRYKWALTEDTPVIKAYDQAAWSELEDSFQTSGEEAVEFIATVHKRWLRLLKALTPEQWGKSFVHPETGKEVLLTVNLGLYVWHGRHHYAHIQNLINREGW